MKKNKYTIEGSQNLVLNEPQGSWGGSWTEKKLDAFEKYVRSYLTIMKEYAPKYGWKLFYFDAFAGSGTREDEVVSDNNVSLFDDTDLQDMIEQSHYKGAAERVLGIQIEDFAFDYYYFVDKDLNAINKLKQKLTTEFPHKTSQMAFLPGDANEQLLKLVEYAQSHPNTAALVLLDPFGMQLDWSTVQALKTIKRIDLWILVPSGVIINRLLTRKGKVLCEDRLSKVFGMSVNELKKYFYVEKKQNTFFGEESRLEKSRDSIAKIAQLYLSRLSEEFKEVIKEPLVLCNSTRPIFHFVFASHNKAAKKIASEIIFKQNQLR